MKGLELLRQMVGLQPSREVARPDDLGLEVGSRMVSYLETDPELWRMLNKFGPGTLVVLRQSGGLLDREISIGKHINGDRQGFVLMGTVGMEELAHWARMTFEWVVPRDGSSEAVLNLVGVETRPVSGATPWKVDTKNREYLLRGAMSFFDRANFNKIRSAI